MNEPAFDQAAGPRANLRDLSYAALQAQIAVWGEPKFRARQLWQWLYVHLATE